MVKLKNKMNWAGGILLEGTAVNLPPALEEKMIAAGTAERFVLGAAAVQKPEPLVPEVKESPKNVAAEPAQDKSYAFRVAFPPVAPQAKIDVKEKDETQTAENKGAESPEEDLPVIAPEERIRLAKTLNKLTREELAEGAEKASVKFNAEARKAEIIDAIITQGKADMLLSVGE